jgi:hypothetical protein
VTQIKKFLEQEKKHSKEMIKLFDLIINPFKKNGFDKTAKNKRNISNLNKYKKEYEDMFNYTPNQWRKWASKLLLLKKNIIEKFILGRIGEYMGDREDEFVAEYESALKNLVENGSELELLN